MGIEVQYVRAGESKVYKALPVESGRQTGEVAEYMGRKITMSRRDFGGRRGFQAFAGDLQTPWIHGRGARRAALTRIYHLIEAE